MKNIDPVCEALEAELNQILADCVNNAAEAFAEKDLSKAITWFSQLRNDVKLLSRALSALQSHVDEINYQLIPTLFQNSDTKTHTTADGLRATLVQKWTASITGDVQAAFEFLRNSGNEGLIIETVNANTLGAWIRAEIEAGRPGLPDHLFTVKVSPHTRLTET